VSGPRSAGGWFPVEDVEASLADHDLQRRHRYDELPEGEREHLERLRFEAIEPRASGEPRWIYFRSPTWTWRHLCGREGWLLYDREARYQYAFELTVMN
jgi:hypothetical protein